MAIPRIFVSSTCYDLQEIRFQLRHFIQDFGYEPVMSEFDDIFYNYETHVQDSCLNEISKCQLFALVVGNNYGSIYHQEHDNNNIPDSVTLKEFKKALKIDIYKHVFVNKFVDYDYKNYQRALNKKMLQYFKGKNVEDDKINDTKLDIKKKFDESYPFPYESYKYVFYFLDIIHDLKNGNAYNTFESFADIKESLKKQWAGFMYESLTRKDKSELYNIEPLREKISNIDSSLKKLLETKSVSQDSTISFDISKISRETNIDNLEKFQDKINNILYAIFYYERADYEGGEIYYSKRIWFNKKLTLGEIKTWLKSLDELITDYKWSKFISVKDIFKNVPMSKYMTSHLEIPYKTIFELLSIYESLSNKDKSPFEKTIQHKFIEAYEPPVVNDDVGVDLPF